MCQQIADNVVTFLLQEIAHGRIPPEFLPLQSGVGNINNAVMARLGENPEIPPFMMYSEVLQESVVHLLETGKISGASASSLTISADSLRKIYDNMDYFASRIVLRPQEISNNPEIIRRLGVIALNVGLEFDIYGHANSTHVAGVDLMNGIGAAVILNATRICRSLWLRRLLKKARSQPSCQCAAMLITANTASK